MTTINKNTKKGQYYIDAYNRSKIVGIYDAYARPSSTKVRAYNYYYCICQNEKGKDFRIISTSGRFFSIAWKVPEGLRVETYGNSYLIK